MPPLFLSHLAPPFFSILSSKKGGHLKGGAYIQIHTNGPVKYRKIFGFWRFSILHQFLDPCVPPLLPPLFRNCRMMKSVASRTFCTKNDIHIIFGSQFMSVWIWARSSKNHRFFGTSRYDSRPSFCQFPAKNEFFDFKRLHVLK